MLTVCICGILTGRNPSISMNEHARNALLRIRPYIFVIHGITVVNLFLILPIHATQVVYSYEF